MSLLLIGIFAVVSGVWSLVLPRGSFALPLTWPPGPCSVCFRWSTSRYNRNAVRLYLRDLGWSPVVLRLLIAAAISLVLLVPVLRLT